MWTKTFWKQVGERFVKTVAQVAAAMLTADGLGLLTADWVNVGQVAGLAGIVSLLTSIGSAAVGPEESPSLVETVPLPSPEAVRLLGKPPR